MCKIIKEEQKAIIITRQKETACTGTNEMICPKCGRGTPAANTNCSNCGFPIGSMPKALNLLKKAKQARDNGDMEKAAALFNRVLFFWPNHTEALTLLQEIEARQTKMTQLARQLNTGNPLKFPGISKILIGMAGPALSFNSLTSLIEIIANLIKDNTYMGSEPYLAAAVISLIICAAISGWGIKAMVPGELFLIAGFPEGDLCPGTSKGNREISNKLPDPPSPVTPSFAIFQGMGEKIQQRRVGTTGMHPGLDIGAVRE
jgi:ribosomal protein L37E